MGKRHFTAYVWDGKSYPLDRINHSINLMKMHSVLITGANRGIGLEFARAYAGIGWRVFATCRAPDRALTLADLATKTGSLVSLHQLDVTSDVSVTTLAKELRNESIDILINNAGAMLPAETFGNYNYEKWVQTYEVNTVGAARVTEALINQVAASDRKVVAAISSGLGSIADNTSGGWAAYRASKAALNMTMKTLSLELVSRGIACVVMSPGWVQTDMGGANAHLTPEESVSGMREVLDQVSIATTGRFYHYTSQEYPW